MHSDHRPDPDAVLAKVAAESSSTGEGRLKIFFGYAAGVGKTYAMLAAAQVARREGREVVVGYVEPHARPETEALLEGFEILPRRQLRHRDITLQEFDLDAALARRPALLLVDELAHSNEEGCRHPKRWQDVAELLAAGISVYTTLNVQHLDSLNDVVARITGVLVRETVPDDAVDRADEIELVDLPPDELLERFRRGRVYLPEQAARAAERFFKKDTLVALRELALRKMAEHVHRQVELGRRSLAARPIWATQHRLLVAVGPSPSSARLVRATRRLATELRAPWYAVAVQDPARIEREGEPRTENLARNLRLAEQLGAEVVTLVDADIPGALVNFAHDRGVTRLVVGKTAEPAWKRLLRPTIVDAVTRRSGELEILVISGDAPDAATPAPGPHRVAKRRLRGLGRHLGVVAGVLALATAAGFGLRALAVDETNIVALFVLAVAVVAYATNRQASIVAALGAVLLFNFFFTVPFYTLAVADPGYLVTFAVMLLIGLAISALVGRVRAQAAAARQRADANDILYRVSQALAAAPTRHQVAAETQRRLEQLLGGEAAVLLPDAAGEGLGEAFGAARLISDPRERAVADWAFRQRRPAGAGTDTLPAAAGLYLPLLSRDGTRFGLLAVAGPSDGPPARELRQILDSIAALAAQALERCALEESARRSHATAEAERLRSDLLATVSHDLRTPLAAISGAMAAVLGSPRSTPERGRPPAPARRRERGGAHQPPGREAPPARPAPGGPRARQPRLDTDRGTRRRGPAPGGASARQRGHRDRSRRRRPARLVRRRPARAGPGEFARERAAPWQGRGGVGNRRGAGCGAHRAARGGGPAHRGARSRPGLPRRRSRAALRAFRPRRRRGRAGHPGQRTGACHLSSRGPSSWRQHRGRRPCGWRCLPEPLATGSARSAAADG